MVLPDDINTAPQRVKSPSSSTTTFKTRLDPFKHRQLFPHPPSTSSSTSSTSVAYPPPTNMFTTPTKATSRFAPYNSPLNRVNFRMRQSPIVASPFNGPGGLRPVSPPPTPTSLASVVNSSPFATPLRRRYTPTRFLSPKSPRSHRGRVPAQSLPRKERSFQSLEKPAAPTTPTINDTPTFTELSDRVYAASAKSKIPAGPDADIFFVQLGKLDMMRSLTKELMNTRISVPDVSPVPDFEARSRARKARRLAEAKASKTPELDSPQRREALHASQRKKLREEALLREEQQRETEHPVAGSSKERTRLSPDSTNKLKRKQQDQKAEEALQEAASASERAKVLQQERAALRRQEEEAARLQAQQAAKQRHDEEAARLQAEKEAAARRKQEELEHQERLARAKAQTAREEEEARRLAAENELRRKAEEVRRKAVEEEVGRKAEEAERMAQEEEVLRKAEAHARWRLQEQKEQRERLERLAREQAQEEARIQAEHARIQAEHARRIAEQMAERARFEAEQTRIFAEDQARKNAEQQARFLAEQEAQRQAEREADLRAHERAQALAAEEARIRAIAEAVAQMQAELNARAQAAFGGGASWHNPHEYYEFNRFQEQRQQHQHQQHQHQQEQQQQPSPEFQHQQPFFEQQQHHQQQQQQHYETHDIPMREPSMADINMEGPGCSTPRCPSPEPTPSPPSPPPPPPPAPFTKLERIKAYHARWKTPIELWGLPIGFKQIPWPVFYDVERPEDITFERLAEFYTYSERPASMRDHRTSARAELKRWHSDKIDGKFSGKLDGTKPMIDAAVKEITRFLHEVLSKM